MSKYLIFGATGSIGTKLAEELYKSNKEIGVPSIRFFDQEVKKYCYMWKEGGEYSTEKYDLNKNI